MRRLIERFYAALFQDNPSNPADEQDPLTASQTDEKPVTFRHKAIVFYITTIVSMVILYLIIVDIIKNVQSG